MRIPFYLIKIPLALWTSLLLCTSFAQSPDPTPYWQAGHAYLARQMPDSALYHFRYAASYAVAQQANFANAQKIQQAITGLLAQAPAHSLPGLYSLYTAQAYALEQNELYLPAQQAYQQALSLLTPAQRQGNYAAAYIQRPLANIYTRLGQYSTAQTLLQQALNTAKQQQNTNLQAECNIDLHTVLLEQGQIAPARAVAQQIGQLAPALPPRNLAMWHLKTAQQALQQQDTTQALEAVQQGLALPLPYQDSTRPAWQNALAAQHLSGLYALQASILSQQDFEQALAAAQQALSLAQKAYAPTQVRVKGKIGNQLARLYLQAQMPEQAQTYLTQSLALFLGSYSQLNTAVPDSLLQAENTLLEALQLAGQCYQQLAQTATTRQQPHYQAGLYAYEAALKVLAHLQAVYIDPNATIQLHQTFAALPEQILQHLLILPASQWNSRQWALAFAAFEAVQGNALHQQLARARAWQGPDSLAQQVQTLQRSLAQLSQQRSLHPALLATNQASSYPGPALNELDSLMAQQQIQLNLLMGTANAPAATGTSTTNAIKQPFINSVPYLQRLQQVQRFLFNHYQHGWAQILQGQSHTYVILITQHHKRLVRFAHAPFHALYQQYFAYLQKPDSGYVKNVVVRLPAKFKEALNFVRQHEALTALHVVPHGIFYNLPAELWGVTHLTTGQLSYLGSHLAVHYQHAAGILLLQAQRPAYINAPIQAYAPSYNNVVANNNMVAQTRGKSAQWRWQMPPNGLPALAPLPGARQEIANIQQLFPQARLYTDSLATRQQFLMQAAQGGWHHLAMHANTYQDLPQLSALYFNNAALPAATLYAQNLPLQMAVLSACNTAQGPQVKGEGVYNLARAFAWAGTRNTVVSLWPVPDEATRIIMQEFYNELAQGKEAAQALRQAKITYVAQAPPLRQHPWYWAGFIINGPPVYLVEPPKQQELPFEFVVVLVALICISLFFGLKFKRESKAPQTK